MVDPEASTVSVVLYQLVVAAQVDKQGTGLNAEVDNWTAQVSWRRVWFLGEIGIVWREMQIAISCQVTTMAKQ